MDAKGKNKNAQDKHQNRLFLTEIYLFRSKKSEDWPYACWCPQGTDHMLPDTRDTYHTARHSDDRRHAQLEN